MSAGKKLKPTSPVQGRETRSIAQILSHELSITVQLCRSNAIGFLFILVGGFLSRLIRGMLPPAELGIVFFQVLCLDLLCNYTFDIANQTSSPEEDFINKPHRPIPAGLLTMKQAKTRWGLVWTLSPTVLYALFGPWPMIHLLHWHVLISVCYVWPKWFNWFMRNYFASFSYCILGRFINSVVSRNRPNWSISFGLDLTIFFWFMATIHIQEFQDLEGDRKAARRTLPMMLSDRGLVVLRVGTSSFVLTFGTALCYAGWLLIDKDVFIAPMCILQQLLSCNLAYRIVASNGPEYDKKTYHVHYYGPVMAILLSLSLITKYLTW